MKDDGTLYQPIDHYLMNHYNEQDRKWLLRQLIFLHECNGQYSYKNKITRGNITVDKQGTLIECAATALRTLQDYYASSSYSKRKSLY
ncbi:hypothetical protein ACFSTH_02875 [Paenibacillus yanchengensis]|uniref:Uncharacterized protein n=1 Tax=Paenibacillus yanchengensis TaxID=2035833 RepID=A0ABW4YG98_9BACL